MTTREWLLKKLIASELELVSMKSAIEVLEGQLADKDAEIGTLHGTVSQYHERTEGDMVNAARLLDYTSAKVFRVLERMPNGSKRERQIIANRAFNGVVEMVIEAGAAPEILELDDGLRWPLEKLAVSADGSEITVKRRERA